MPETNGSTTPTTEQVLKDAERYSVTGAARDGLFTFVPAGVPDMTPGIFIQLGQVADQIPDWNYLYPNWRDERLKRLARSETMMAGAVYSMKARMQTLNHVLNGDNASTKQDAMNLLNTAHYGAGFKAFVGLVMDDLLTTDNGAFIELYGPGRPDLPLGQRKIVGFAHLDSRLCWRTFNPEYPVIYTNPQTGQRHKLHASRVLALSDNTQPVELARGIGYCAVSRALHWVKIVRDTIQYRDEKVGGRFTRAIGAIEGVTKKQLQEALAQTNEEADGLGFVVYKGIPFLVAPGMQSGSRINIQLQDLASIPDGFNFTDDMTLYAFVLALAFGVDAREFWPATTSGATKADAAVQNMKARGRAIGLFVQTLEDLVRRILAHIDDSLTFEYDYTDDEQDRQAAEIQAIRVSNLSTLKAAGAITAEMMLSLAIADGIIDGDVIAGMSPPADSDDTQANQQELDLPEEAGDAPPGDEDEEALEAKKKDLRSPANATYESRTNEFQLSFQRLVERFIQSLPGQMDAELAAVATQRLQMDMLKAMSGGLTEALGVGLGGEQPTATGVQRLSQIGSIQFSFIANSFIPDLRVSLVRASNAGATGQALRDAVSSFVSRAGLYAGAYWEAIWLGLGDRLRKRDKPPRVRRLLDVHADHCETCPVKARIYDSFDDMVLQAGIPGDGSDACGGNCRCHCEVELTPGKEDWSRLTDSPTVFTTSLLRF